MLCLLKPLQSPLGLLSLCLRGLFLFKVSGERAGLVWVRAGRQSHPHPPSVKGAELPLSCLLCSRVTDAPGQRTSSPGHTQTQQHPESQVPCLSTGQTARTDTVGKIPSCLPCCLQSSAKNRPDRY